MQFNYAGLHIKITVQYAYRPKLLLHLKHYHLSRIKYSEAFQICEPNDHLQLQNSLHVEL